MVPLTTKRPIIDGHHPGFGAIESLPNSRIDRLWEEHGVIRLSEADRGLRVGDIVSIIPNHVCPTINLADRWFGVRDGVVERDFRVAARGATQ